MLTYEYKLDGTHAQFAAIDEGIRVVQFIRNKCLRAWMDRTDEGKSFAAMSAYPAVLAKQFPFADRLGSQARQAAAERAWNAVQRFSDNCKAKKPGKKGYPRFQKDCRSIEYKVAGWKLATDGRQVTFSDGLEIGTLRLVGTRNIETVPEQQIQRVRIIRRADGYYGQFCVDAERQVAHIPTGKQIGSDMGLNAFYTDSDGHTEDNPRHYRKAEKKLKKLQPRVSRKKKGSNTRKKSRKSLAQQHLKVPRQREDHARKLACALVTSTDLIAFEDVQVRNLIRNHYLAKSISDAGWSPFLRWVQYYARLHGIEIVAVPPAYTSHNCSLCHAIVKKSLSVRTHCCPHCGLILDRDLNAALNILQEAIRILGPRKTAAS
jgi:putative transposase